MSISAFSGPVTVYGQATPQSGGAQDYNGWRGPSLFDQGHGILDPRIPFTYSPGQRDGQAFYGWLGTTGIPVLDVAPAAKATGAVAAAANVTNGTAMTLVSADGAGIVVNKSVVDATTGQTVTGLLAVGQVMAGLAFGSAASVNIWDPTKALTRVLSITGSASATGGDFLVSGYDVYGYPQTETITAAAGATTTNGKKAWKYIKSVTPQFTDAHNYSVDTTDIFGFGLRVDEFGYVRIIWNNAVITANTGFTAADTTSPATKTTGDVRGTYAVQSASDGSKILQIFITPSVANIGSYTGTYPSGLVGVQPA